MLRRRQGGVTLVELMIGVTIVSILLLAGIPSFTRWMQDSQNRTAAESILNGLHLARVEAIKRNTLVRFELVDTDGLVNWTVGCVTETDDCPQVIQRREAAEGTPNARVGVADIPTPTPDDYFDTPIVAGVGLDTGEASVTFNGVGRVQPNGGGADIERIDVTNATPVGGRRYVVTINSGGQIRMCDPALSFSNNPQGCS